MIVRLGIDDDLIAGREPLTFAEVGKDVGIAPARRAAFGPRVEVARVASNVSHIVDAGRAAQHFAAGHGHAPSVQTEAGLAGVCRVHPVGDRIELQGGTRGRNRAKGLAGAVLLKQELGGLCNPIVVRHPHSS